MNGRGLIAAILHPMRWLRLWGIAVSGGSVYDEMLVWDKHPGRLKGIRGRAGMRGIVGLNEGSGGSGGKARAPGNTLGQNLGYHESEELSDY